MSKIIADIHCHPTIKPYGQSFPNLIHSKNMDDKNCIFYYDPQSFWDKLKNRFANLTDFSQANFTALKKGEVNIIVANLYPIEKGFFRTNFGTGSLIDILLNIITNVGKKRIDFIQDLETGYFSDLNNELEFLKKHQNEIFIIDGEKVKYKIIHQSSDIEISAKNDEVFIINVLIALEGAHAFFNFIKDINYNKHTINDIKTEVGKNIKQFKKNNTLLYVSIAHHFYNGLLGHAPSLTDISTKIFNNQLPHINETINDFGIEIIKKLLNQVDEKRILIDIKHMSVESRNKYFELLDNEYKDENIPIIISHGCVRGNDNNRELFFDEDINFSDEDIIRVGKSNGLFGIQLDKRRIGSKEIIKKFNRYTRTDKVLFFASQLVWRQIQHIAETLDDSDCNAWNIQCIGSDFDGIINPISGYWTAEDFKVLNEYLLKHAEEYTNSSNYSNMKNSYNNNLTAEEIVAKVMGTNAYEFIKRNI